MRGGVGAGRPGGTGRTRELRGYSSLEELSKEGFPKDRCCRSLSVHVCRLIGLLCLLFCSIIVVLAARGSLAAGTCTCIRVGELVSLLVTCLIDLVITAFARAAGINAHQTRQESGTCGATAALGTSVTSPGHVPAAGSIQSRVDRPRTTVDRVTHGFYLSFRPATVLLQNLFTRYEYKFSSQRQRPGRPPPSSHRLQLYLPAPAPAHPRPRPL